MNKYPYLMLLLFMSAACTMPETKIYSLSLSPETETQDMKTDSSVNIVVHSRRYLSQPYIAYRISPYQLEIAQYSKWDSSPLEIVREAFKERLSSDGIFREVRTSNFPTQGSYSLDIDLKRFERADEGNDSFSYLTFDLRFFSPEGEELFAASFSKRAKLEDRSFLSLAKSLSLSLAEGIKAKEKEFIKSISGRH